LGPRQRSTIAPHSLPDASSTETPPPTTTIENENEFSLANCFDTYGMPTTQTPLLDVSRRLHDHATFLSFKAGWEAEMRSSAPPPPPQRSANSAFKDFRAVYNTVDGHYFTRLPKGNKWMLHQARVAREKGDVQAIRDLRVELESKVQEYIEMDRHQLQRKEASLAAGFKKYDDKLAKGDAGSSSQSEAGYDSDSSVEI